MATEEYDRSKRSKYYIPLESNPQVFTQLIHNLGLTSLEFQDVLSLDEPELLSFIPRPVHGFVLAFPSAEWYKQYCKDDEKRTMYEGKGEDEDVVWYEQTIGNACGLYGILHAVSNGKSRSIIPPDSALGRLLKEIIPLGVRDRARALEANGEVESAHAAAGVKGDTAPPPRPDVDTDHHYVAFVPSHKNGKIYQLDGVLKGPVDSGVVLGEGEDMLSDKAIGVVKRYIELGASDNIGFSLLALVARN